MGTPQTQTLVPKETERGVPARGGLKGEIRILQPGGGMKPPEWLGYQDLEVHCNEPGLV